MYFSRMVALILTYLCLASAVLGIAMAEEEKYATSLLMALFWPFTLIALATNNLYTKWKAKRQ